MARLDYLKQPLNAKELNWVEMDLYLNPLGWGNDFEKD
jgi:hypothetical protein